MGWLQYWGYVRRTAHEEMKILSTDVPAVYFIQKLLRIGFSMLDHKVLAYPCYQMVFEAALDDLMEEVR